MPRTISKISADHPNSKRFMPLENIIHIGNCTEFSLKTLRYS